MGSKEKPVPPSSAFPSVEHIRRASEQVGRQIGARLIVLFGSAARGASTAPGDLDLGVLTEGPLDVISVTNRFIELLAVQQIDVADLRHADPVLLALLARDGIPMYEAEPGCFARFASLAARRFADTGKFRAAERKEIQEFLSSTRRAR